MTTTDVARMAAQFAALDAEHDALKALQRAYEATGRTAKHQIETLRRIHAGLPTGPDKAVFELLIEDVDRAIAAEAAYHAAYAACRAVVES